MLFLIAGRRDLVSHKYMNFACGAKYIQGGPILGGITNGGLPQAKCDDRTKRNDKWRMDIGLNIPLSYLAPLYPTSPEARP